MCITTTNALPSRNPNDCPGCSGGDSVLCDAVWWTALARLTLCDECRITVRGYIEEEGGLDPAYAYEDDDGGPDGPPVDHDAEPFYGHDLDGYMGEEGY